MQNPKWMMTGCSPISGNHHDISKISHGLMLLYCGIYECLAMMISYWYLGLILDIWVLMGHTG